MQLTLNIPAFALLTLNKNIQELRLPKEKKHT